MDGFKSEILNLMDRDGCEMGIEEIMGWIQIKPLNIGEHKKT